MVELSLFLSILAVTLPICVTGVFIAKIYRKNAALDPKITNKLRKQQDEYIAELEHKVRQKQNKLNSMEKAPSIIGDKEDIEGILPDIVGELSTHLPKWLQKIVKNNPDLVNQALELAKKHPDKARELFGKFVKTKSQASTADEEALSGL